MNGDLKGRIVKFLATVGHPVSATELYFAVGSPSDLDVVLKRLWCARTIAHTRGGIVLSALARPRHSFAEEQPQPWSCR